MARGITSRTISVILNRLKGIPRSAGSWQASALICATSSGGKNERSASSWFIHQSLLSPVEETLSPFANCFSWKIKSFTNFLVLHIVCSHENYLCSDYIPMRCRIFSDQVAQMLLLFPSQHNLEWTFSRHDIPLSCRKYPTSISSKNQEIIRNTTYEMDQ